MSEEMKTVRCGCGGEAVIDQTEGYDEYQVYCPKCFMQSGTYNTEAEAITAWNRAMSVDYKMKSTERKKGEWIDTDNYYQRWKCSECGCHTRDAEPNFCPNCGADMR